MKNLFTYLSILLCGLLLACSPKLISDTTATKPTTTAPTTISVSPAKEMVQTTLASIEGKKVLMVHGGWKGHQPKEYTEKVADILRAEGADVTVSPSVVVYEDSTFMASLDLIIQSVTMDKISKEQLDGLLKAVKMGGTGFAGCHGGAGDSFRAATDYQYMVGGQFINHPGGQVDHSVQITDSYDAVTQGINDFPIHSEQYYMHVDPNVKVLATTTFSAEHNDWIAGATMPVIWKKYFGEGRVFYFSVGHNPELFDDIPAAREILIRGFRWASGSKYEAKEKWLSPVYPSKKK